MTVLAEFIKLQSAARRCCRTLYIHFLRSRIFMKMKPIFICAIHNIKYVYMHIDASRRRRRRVVILLQIISKKI